MINYGLVYKGCRCRTGILDAAVFTATSQKWRVASHGETRAMNHVADCGPKLGVGSPALCVALLNGQFSSQRRGSNILPFSL